MPTIALTGISGFWGRQVAQRLLLRPDVRVLGIDRLPPEPALPGADFVKADIRNPLLAELFAAERVDTLLHLAWREPAIPDEADFESNVLGTMQLFGMAVEGGVRRVLWRSSTAVYGAAAQNPLYLPENSPLAEQVAAPLAAHWLEIERFVATFAAEYSSTAFAALRLAHVIGAEAKSPLNRLLRQPLWPALLGFDPLLQVLDSDDAVEALALAALGEWRGAVNVAAAGVLAFSQLAGKAGRPLLPLLHPLVMRLWPLAQTMPQGERLLRWLPLDPDQLRFSCLADCTQMGTVLGFAPQLNAAQAVERAVQQQRVRRYQPADAMSADQIMVQRQQTAGQQAP
ncbi:MAG: NAD-dependent epimerase/dehydratase family protein [Caldilineales bacterium]